jgi:hypothetical protein
MWPYSADQDLPARFAAARRSISSYIAFTSSKESYAFRALAFNGCISQFFPSGVRRDLRATSRRDSAYSSVTCSFVPVFLCAQDRIYITRNQLSESGPLKELNFERPKPIFKCTSWICSSIVRPMSAAMERLPHQRTTT